MQGTPRWWIVLGGFYAIFAGVMYLALGFRLGGVASEFEKVRHSTA